MTIVTFRGSKTSGSLAGLIEKRDWPRLLKAIDDGAPPHALANGNMTVFERLFYVCGEYDPSPRERIQQHDLVQLMLERAPLVDLVRFTPLTMAAMTGRLDLAELLLSMGHDPNVVGADHDPASSLAMFWHRGALNFNSTSTNQEVDSLNPRVIRQSKVLDFLFHSGLHVNRAVHQNLSTLFLACLVKNNPMVSLLLSHGADPNASAFDLTTNPDFSKLPPLEAAIGSMNEGAVAQLVRAGADPMRASTFQMGNNPAETLVELAARMGLPGMLQSFREIVPPGSRVFDRAWLIALGKGNLEMTDWFLRQGFSIDDPLIDGRRPAQVVALHGRELLFMKLMAMGADMTSAQPDVWPGAWDILKFHHPEIASRLHVPSAKVLRFRPRA